MNAVRPTVGDDSTHLGQQSRLYRPAIKVDNGAKSAQGEESPEGRCEK
jgi:hypothetical protein